MFIGDILYEISRAQTQMDRLITNDDKILVYREYEKITHKE